MWYKTQLDRWSANVALEALTGERWNLSGYGYDEPITADNYNVGTIRYVGSTSPPPTRPTTWPTWEQVLDEARAYYVREKTPAIRKEALSRLRNICQRAIAIAGYGAHWDSHESHNRIESLERRVAQLEGRRDQDPFRHSHEIRDAVRALYNDHATAIQHSTNADEILQAEAVTHEALLRFIEDLQVGHIVMTAIRSDAVRIAYDDQTALTRAQGDSLWVPVGQVHGELKRMRLTQSLSEHIPDGSTPVETLFNDTNQHLMISPVMIELLPGYSYEIQWSKLPLTVWAIA